MRALPLSTGLLVAATLATAALANDPLGQGVGSNDLESDGMPKVTYSIDEQGPALPSHGYFDPLLDTPRFGNPATTTNPAGTCYGIVRLVQTWYQVFVHPILANPGLYRPPNSIEALGVSWPVNEDNLHQFRLRAYTQPRGADHPHARPHDVARLATNFHNDQFAGAGYFRLKGATEAEARNQAQRLHLMLHKPAPDHHGWMADQMIQDLDDPARAMSGIVVAAPQPPPLPGGAATWHAMLVVGYRRVRVTDTRGASQAAVKFRLFDPSVVETAEDSEDLRDSRYLLYLESSQAFTFSLGFLLDAADQDPPSYYQLGHVLQPYDLAYIDLHSEPAKMRVFLQNLLEGDQTQGQPDSDFDWGG